jgi:hypothetical protein
MALTAPFGLKGPAAASRGAGASASVYFYTYYLIRRAGTD